MAAAEDDKKTAENLARLPAKLRERLLKRGILKAEAVSNVNHYIAFGSEPRKTAEPGAAAAPTGDGVPEPAAAKPCGTPALETAACAAPGTPPGPQTAEPFVAPGTPPDPEAAVGKPCAAPGTPPDAEMAVAEERPALGTPPGTPPEEAEEEDDDDEYDAFATEPTEAILQEIAEAKDKAASGPPPPPMKAAPPASKAAAVAFAGAAAASGAIAKQPPPVGACAKQPPPAGALAKQPPPAGALAKQPPPVGAQPKQPVVQRAMMATPTAFDDLVAEAARKAAEVQIATALLLPPAVTAAAAPAPQPEPLQPVKTSYSSAPVIDQAAVAALKRGASAAPADEPEPKKPAADAAAETTAATPELSPAETRARAAQAAGEAQAPTWIFPAATGGTGAVGTTGVAMTSAAVQKTAAAATSVMSPPAGAPPSGPPLPPGWVRVPHEDDFYYWNTVTNEVKWEHPAEPQQKQPEKKEVFTEEHKILWSDIGRIIGRQGINLKIIKASIGCTIKVPRQGGKDGKGGKGGKGGKDAKGGKGKGKDKAEVVRGRGDGSKEFEESDFAKVIIQGETAHLARGGKRCLEVMLGYGRNVEGALAALGVEVKQPPLEELEPKLAPKKIDKDGIDPMDPASYSDAPVGGWGAGMKKMGADGKMQGAKKTGPSASGADSKTENAERF